MKHNTLPDYGEIEKRVKDVPSKKLHLWKGASHFMLQSGTARSAERWQLHTPRHIHYGDTLQSVVEQACEDYPLMITWLREFREEGQS